MEGCNREENDTESGGVGDDEAQDGEGVGGGEKGEEVKDRCGVLRVEVKSPPEDPQIGGPISISLDANSISCIGEGEDEGRGGGIVGNPNFEGLGGTLAAHGAAVVEEEGGEGGVEVSVAAAIGGGGGGGVGKEAIVVEGAEAGEVKQRGAAARGGRRRGERGSVRGGEATEERADSGVAVGEGGETEGAGEEGGAEGEKEEGGEEEGGGG